MGREEQVEEREVLDSIFPDEITDVSETEYRISIVLDVLGDEEPPTMLLQVRYPEAYPDEAPMLDLQSTPNAAPHEWFNVSQDKERLLQGLEETIQENLGMAMVFTLVTTLKEAAENLVEERKQAKDKEHEEAVLAAEREENKKFQGTPVTPETFLKWRADFIKEMEELRQKEDEERLAELKKAKVKEPVKLTGKQLWERGLAGKVDDDDDEGGLTEGVEKLKVEAA
ncbi:RWD domain-containing protein [Colletotrichum siamense]|uniref:RWD domain-containing protein n=1 Tax=Colletotrichum siamense TaxID=690259 RepID=UPI00187256EF|nr:RWD domain-containing protein [Colletotrichum siamense]KAI8152972.1 RWD domain-containing protein [Colletotrichum sp. SAR 10_71]KAI8156353.1 RWD domain-containing protein [Colletotrichum sp. SAR 10_70]KAI8217544.1 RWD domain-containing protein [Colletotrichum sp. SAR 10_77]KAI8225571.1 RWD domain-containing protein [Colletotrichum sp. SAR 10_96]KAI8252845.1 RWD domain-containing protein [Colletotrichum sp. SAR 10_98]KAJ5009044.1 RWD domain-containing protein [Colletotrichum sp. SAR 10_99]